LRNPAVGEAQHNVRGTLGRSDAVGSRIANLKRSAGYEFRLSRLDYLFRPPTRSGTPPQARHRFLLIQAFAVGAGLDTNLWKSFEYRFLLI
jgi:hypothetical protein